MYSSTFLRVQLDLNVFLPARVESFFSQYVCVLHNGLLTKRYVPPSDGKSCTYIYRYIHRCEAVFLLGARLIFSIISINSSIKSSIILVRSIGVREIFIFYNTWQQVFGIYMRSSFLAGRTVFGFRFLSLA